MTKLKTEWLQCPKCGVRSPFNFGTDGSLEDQSDALTIQVLRTQLAEAQADLSRYKEYARLRTENLEALRTELSILRSQDLVIQHLPADDTEGGAL